MTENDQREQLRVSKREFLAKVSTRSNIPIKTVNRVYDTILDELLDTMRRGDQLMLTGFGKFYPQAHKGHRVQFADGGAKAIDDYFVLKFSATRDVNKSLVQAPYEPGTPFMPEADDSDDAELQPTEAGGDADQDALFDTEPVAKVKAKPKAKAAPRTPAAKTRKATTPSASLAASATQSTRAINRARRLAVDQAVNEATADKAI